MKTKLTLISLAGVLALSACSPSKDKDKHHQQASVVSEEEVIKQAKSKEEAAEKLALAGEKMLPYTGGFIHANEILGRALELDPKNTRAIFYKGLIAPMIAQKGILARISPWMSTQSSETQERHRQMIADIPMSELKYFLSDGPQDMETISDIQNYISSVGDTLLVGRNAINSIKNTPLVLNVAYGEFDRNDTECMTKKLATGVYEIPNCVKSTDYTQVRLSRPDYEALSLSYLALSVSTTWMYTSYSLEGLEKVARTIELETQKTGYVNSDKVLSIIKSEPQFLKLRNPQALKNIVTLGSEGLEAIRYALKHQPQLCKQGTEDAANRPGHLFSNGFCVTPEASHAMVFYNALVNGPYQVANTIEAKDGSGETESYVTEVNLGQFLSSPPADLKSLLPASVDSETNTVKFADETLGGLFPNGDASQFFNFSAERNSSATLSPVKELK